MTSFFQSVTGTANWLYTTVYGWPVAAQIGLLICAVALGIVLRRISVASQHELFRIVCAIAAAVCAIAALLALVCLGMALFYQVTGSLPSKLPKLPSTTPSISG